MKFSSTTLFFAIGVGPALAFTNPSSPYATPATTTTTSLQAEHSSNNVFSTFCATAAMSALLWGSPAIIAEQAATHQLPFGLSDVVEHNLVASAKDKASATGSRVNKDAESLLRYGLPINSKEVRELQADLETIKQDVASKRKGPAVDGAKKVKSILASKKAAKMASVCRDPAICTDIMKEIDMAMDPFTVAVKTSQDAFTGSLEERDALDKAYNVQENAAKLLTKLEEQMVPDGYKTPVPSIYSDLPQLEQRATIEMVIKKPTPDAKFDINGVNFAEARMKMVIDGYTSPVTGGNFVDLVNKGFYDNMAIQRSDGFVVQTGDPDGEAVGYTGGKPSKSIGQGPKGERLIPCEISVIGDKGPFYETTIEDEGRGGEATILPFSSYGAMGWARDEYDPNSGSSQFFWLLFDSDLTPAGKNVLDGRYPCFGYVVEGADFLQDVKEGDIIVSAKVTEGLEYLKEGSSSS
jgi:cyclophilin family peptidyl-prolyl cis-trans isomerase